mmetsp:Transcript_51498/g.117173  ORF Transcript_51498/g.117173 Transcript_51498/m.117173 type:complete len:205 (+) Transcript_51498:458-1072(+)
MVALVELHGEVGTPAAEDCPDEVDHALEDRDEDTAPSPGVALLALALPAGVRVLKRVVNVPVVVVVVPEGVAVRVPLPVVPEERSEVAGAARAAVVAVGARGAEARGPVVVAEAVVGPLARVVAVHGLGLGRVLRAAAVGAVGAHVADGGEKGVVAVSVVAVVVVAVVVVLAVVVAVEASVVVVVPVPLLGGAVVAEAVEGVLA